MGVAEKAKRIIRLSDGKIIEDSGHSVPETEYRSSIPGKGNIKRAVPMAAGMEGTV